MAEAPPYFEQPDTRRRFQEYANEYGGEEAFRMINDEYRRSIDVIPPVDLPRGKVEDNRRAGVSRFIPEGTPETSYDRLSRHFEETPPIDYFNMGGVDPQQRYDWLMRLTEREHQRLREENPVRRIDMMGTYLGSQEPGPGPELVGMDNEALNRLVMRPPLDPRSDRDGRPDVSNVESPIPNLSEYYEGVEDFVDYNRDNRRSIFDLFNRDAPGFIFRPELYDTQFRHEEVARRQRDLREAGYDVTIDGVVGPSTEEAWEDYTGEPWDLYFMRERHPQDSELTPAMLRKLRANPGPEIRPNRENLGIDPRYVD